MSMIKTNTISRKPLYLLILFIAFLGAFIYTFDSKIAMLGDNAYYYTLGKALSHGEGYVNISRITKSPNNHYPPGYPAIISVILLLGGGIFTIKLVNGLFLFLSILIFFELSEKLLENQPLAFIISLFITVNAHILLYSSIMMSEVPFMFFSGLSILLFTRVDHSRLSFKDFNLIGSILSMFMAYYLRSLGLALLAGYALYFLLNKQWKPMALYIISLVAAAVPWFVRGQSIGGSSYLNQLTMINPYQPNLGRADFGDFVERFFSNVGRYITWEIPSALFPVKQVDYSGAASGAEWFVGIIILALTTIGLLQLKKYRWVMVGYVLGTFGILMLWPSVWVGVRFIVPLIPVLLIGFFHGLIFLASKISMASANKPFSPYLLLIFLLFAISPVNALNKSAKAPYSPAWKNYFNTAKWVNQNLPGEVVISCGKPALFYLQAETYTMRYKFAQNPNELIKDLEEKQVDYVVVDQVYGNTFRYLVPAIRQYPDRFEQVLHLKNPDTYLLKFKRN